MSIAGMSGLFRLVAQTKNGFVVESLNDKKRYPIQASQKISMLEDISVFTRGGDMALKEVFLKMKEHQAAAMAIDPKGSPDALKTFFKTVLPDFDEERVYPSDIKKMITWFQSVKDLVTAEEEKEEEGGEISETLAGSSTHAQHAHPVPEHQKVKASDKKVTSVKTRKKV